MTESISLTIPMEAVALKEAAIMLYNISARIEGRPYTSQDNIPDSQDVAPFERVPPEVTEETPIPPPVTTAPTPTPPPIENVNGVDVDSDGLPWDVRIHGSKRLRTAKDKKWKKIRGVDAALVATVEAELRAAMAASPAAPVTPASIESAPAAPAVTESAPTPPAPIEAPVELYLVEGAEFTADQLRASGWSDGQIEQCEKAPGAPAQVVTMTFPEIMSKITAAINAKQILDTAVSTALNNQGLTSLPLLAARPDLIPAVHAELFPNG